jgi:hypothetical protein
LDRARSVAQAAQRLDCTLEKGDTMKSVTAVENRKEGRRGTGLRLFAAVTLCLLGMLLSGCSQPGQTAKEVGRRHDRVLQLNNQMMLSDIDRTLQLDRPSHLTDKRIP